jgi:hypothetical protein
MLLFKHQQPPPKKKTNHHVEREVGKGAKILIGLGKSKKSIWAAEVERCDPILCRSAFHLARLSRKE